MRKIRVAQIGINEYSHGLPVFRSMRKQEDLFEIVGYALPENEASRLPKAAAELSCVPQLSLEEIFADPAPMVRLTEHGASSIDFVVRVWLKSGDYWKINFDLKEEVYAAFNEKGIEIPFPQMDVHVIK